MGSDKASSSSVTPTEEFKGHRDICVLVVDCDPTCLMIVSGMLRALTYEEGGCGVDLVMTELHMPDMYGLDLLDEIRRTSKLPVVIMSADSNEDVMLKSLRRGAEYYLVKPVLMEM
ncbi:Two-component response regulator ARR1 [Vitis vinifera]|uniref:Two-component response regulator ARR1 n=1 Tax=Vitis vinifera TaxID=29760 RepID=A0A438IW50_VITVI|nr:Two-component response regulator ARR1 [Vitis vinifera]